MPPPEPTRNPLTEQLLDDEPPEPAGDDDAAPRQSGAWLKHVVATAALVGAAFSVYLAVEYPVKKHEFQSLNCVPHAELVSLETAAATAAYADGFPLVLSEACAPQTTADCDGARQAAAHAVDAYCGDDVDGCQALSLAVKVGASPLEVAKLLEKGNNTAPATALTAALAAYCTNSTDPLCLPGGGLATPTTDAAAAACEKAAACGAAKSFYENPRLFCANSTLDHAATCDRLKTLARDVAANASAYCQTLGVLERDTCNLAVTVATGALEHRGKWEEYCRPGILNWKNHTRCLVVRDAIKTALDAAVCRTSPENQKLCDAAYAVAARWGNASAPVPLYDAAAEAAAIYCAEGACDAKEGEAPLARFFHGYVLDEVEAAVGALPAICEAWPETRNICANVTAALTEFCGKDPVACGWLAELARVNTSEAFPWNVTEGERLVVASWRAADAACGNPPAHRGAALRAAFASMAPPASSADARPEALRGILPDRHALSSYACQVVQAIDETADECPAMLPLLAEARATPALRGAGAR